MTSKNIIYGLQDPITFEIRYIGKTEKGLSRPEYHLKKFLYNKKIQKYPLYKWVKKCIKLGKIPKILIIQQFHNSKYLNDAEIFWIDFFKKQGSPILNMTKGGDGVIGYYHTDEDKLNISKKTKFWWENLDINIKQKIIKNNLTNHGKNKIKVIDQYGNYYSSLSDAAKKIGCGVSAVSQAISNNRECKGFYFKRSM